MIRCNASRPSSHTDVGSVQETEQVQQRHDRNDAEVELPANLPFLIVGPDQIATLAVEIMLVAGSRRRGVDLALGRVREIVLLQSFVHDEVRSSAEVLACRRCEQATGSESSDPYIINPPGLGSCGVPRSRRRRQYGVRGQRQVFVDNRTVPRIQ